MSEFQKIYTDDEIKSYSDALLDLLPQKPPFRYLDRILDLSPDHAVGEYTFHGDEWFYKGHFPGNPVTPGVIQIETMAQTSVVAFGLYLMMLEQEKDPSVKPGEYLTVFTDVEAEFMKEVKPGSKVLVKSKKLFWRRRKLRSQADLYLEDGTMAATAKLSGVGIKK